MDSGLLNSEQTAALLGISVTVRYDWLCQSDAGDFVIRGQEVTIDYFQGGRKGQGRIRITNQEIERLLDLMRVRSRPRQSPRPPRPKRGLHHITSRLGRPDDRSTTADPWRHGGRVATRMPSSPTGTKSRVGIFISES